MSSRREGVTRMKKPVDRRPVTKGVLSRSLKILFRAYPVLMTVVVVCLVFGAVTAAVPSVFLQKVLAIIETYFRSGNWSGAWAEIRPLVLTLAGLYGLSLLAITVQMQLMAYITQGFLDKLRRRMFDGMQNLPIRYFDTHKHGDIMSHYTNDIDALRELISQSLPALFTSIIILTAVLGIMLWYSLWMTLVLLVGVVFMVLVSKKAGGGSARYFVRQQAAVGRMEGYVQEKLVSRKI